MSERWPGGIVRSTPVTPTGPLQNGTAPGIWTMEQAAYWTKQGLWPTAGNFLAVEDVFSTWLYTGNNSTQTINNGINLSGNGGMVWTKSRNLSGAPALEDTARGAGNYVYSSSTQASAYYNDNITSFTSTGYTLGPDDNTFNFNYTGRNYVSWTFREASKFFDVVTWTGNGSSGRTISHNLGVAPGCIIVKRTDTTSNWPVYQRAVGATKYLFLNATQAAGTSNAFWNDTEPTSSVFTVGSDATVNANGGTYVAYLYAHDTASDGIIQCGSFTTDGSSNATVSLGWEPQWVLLKGNSAGQPWITVDQMRGFTVNSSSNVAELYPNSSSAEVTAGGISPTSTGFTANAQLSPSTQYIYIAIRRGPMRTPTVGTTVFEPVARTGTGSAVTVSTTVPAVDLSATLLRSGGNYFSFVDRLRGGSYLTSNDSTAEITSTEIALLDANYAVKWPASSAFSGSGNFLGRTYINYFFRRAPSFFDTVCYSGTGAARTVSHNLGVTPELVFVKRRNGGSSWQVYSSSIANTEYLVWDTTAAKATGTNRWNSTTPSSTTFTVGTAVEVNASNGAYVAYLFASCPGVSKVGSYTGTGTTQTINCGFTTGARFVFIKRTDSTGDWYVWDSARGIVAANDPYLLLNSMAAEVTGTDYIDTDNTGFQISSTAPAAINANGGTFIYLAIS